MQPYSIEYIKHKLKKMFTRKTDTGKINDLIDLIFHPWFGKTKGLAEIVDFLCHSINESKLDGIKFVEYNFPSLVLSIVKEIIKAMKDERSE